MKDSKKQTLINEESEVIEDDIIAEMDQFLI